jgi:hypothetical protein
LNTFKDEDLTVAGGTLVPSIQIGSPLSLVGGTSTLTTGDDVITTTSFSKIGVTPAQWPFIQALDFTLEKY